MAARVANAAMTDVRHRRMSDQVRLQTGHMLTYDDLAHSSDLTEKNVLCRVLVQRIEMGKGMMQLPLSLALWLFFVIAYYLHEDITNSYLIESGIRMHTDDMFADLNTIDELWVVLEGSFVDTFFKQEDIYKNPLPKSSGDGDKWGMWGRVDTFNQMVGPVKLEATRKSNTVFGSNYTCLDQLTCKLCRSNAGFQRNSDPVRSNWPCGNGAPPTTQVTTTMMVNASTSSAPSNTGTRRLYFESREASFIFSNPTRSREDRFDVYLFPGDSKAKIVQVLQYYKAREWIDKDTEKLDIHFFILNCELGRCRIEEVKIMLTFSPGGGIYYRRNLIPVFLETWPGKTSIAMDVLFLATWGLTSIYNVILAWRAFLHSELLTHLLKFDVMMETAVALGGLFPCMSIYFTIITKSSVSDVLVPIRAAGWDTTNPDMTAIDKMFAETTVKAEQLELFRTVANFFSLFLMLRFFVHFGALPRIGIITRALSAVATDFLHFVMVFIPIFGAFLGSGVVLFGKSFFTFCTIPAALGSSLRIMMESEYDWENWAQEYWFYSTFWSWLLMVMIVLVMLNMVLAIILDVYNEVRERTGAKEAEPMWTTLYNLILQGLLFRVWVPYRTLLKTVNKSLYSNSVISKEDLKTLHAKISDQQLSILFGDCRREMRQQAIRDLDNRTLLQASGSLMVNLDKANALVRRVNVEESEDPIHVWTTPHTVKTTAQGNGEGRQEVDNFMTAGSYSKGQKNPNIRDPNEEELHHPHQDGGSQEDTPPSPPPQWLEEVQGMLAAQRKWLKHAQWQLEEMKWQMQLGHSAKYQGAAAPEGAVL